MMVSARISDGGTLYCLCGCHAGRERSNGVTVRVTAYYAGTAAHHHVDARIMERASAGARYLLIARPVTDTAYPFSEPPRRLSDASQLPQTRDLNSLLVDY
jgi:hypothetical protein